MVVSNILIEIFQIQNEPVWAILFGCNEDVWQKFPFFILTENSNSFLKESTNFHFDEFSLLRGYSYRLRYS